MTKEELESMLRLMAGESDDAYQCLTEMLDVEEVGITFSLLVMEWGISGEKISTFWRDCCHSDTDTFNKTIQYFMEYHISKKEIDEHLSHKPTTPFI